MLTRCPHCETDFRVTPEQLKVRHGQVRCGTCRGVFNAIDSLTDELLVPMKFPARLPSPPPAATEPGALPDVLPVWMPSEFPQETAQTGAAPPAEPDGDVAETHAGEADAPTEAIPQDNADVAADTAAKNIAPLPQEEATGENDESRRWQDGAMEESTPPTDQPAPAKATFTPVPAAWGPFVETPRPRRWPWSIGIILLLLLAVGQLLYIFRVELAVLTPELRPALLAACEQLGCTLPRPQKAELISIETSDLAPAGAGRLLLTTTLKNRAPFSQEYPLLELTLTDTQDSALLRKVLTPAEYLPADRAAETGFAANSDVVVRLPLDSADIPAVGYRLYLFYP